jgi:succinate dehydrogenase / fumarate reductase, membrane anchor subunit
MHYRSPLANVRGLGSAKTGTSHWWMQRVTAVVLIPLSFWLFIFLDLSLKAPIQEIVAWLAMPLNTIAIVVWVVAVFYHSALGLQVVIEDYVAAEGIKIIAVWTVNLVFIFLALAALIAVFRIISIG